MNSARSRMRIMRGRPPSKHVHQNLYHLLPQVQCQIGSELLQIMQALNRVPARAWKYLLIRLIEWHLRLALTAPRSPVPRGPRRDPRCSRPASRPA